MVHLEVCRSAEELLCEPARSLWPTLVSAASTLALICAANWGLQFFFFSNEESFRWRLLFHILVVWASPLLALSASFLNAWNVWTMKRSMQRRAVAAGNAQQVEKRSFTILCTCPLYIQVPSSALSEIEDESLRSRSYDRVEDPKELCPMQWVPTETAIGGPSATTIIGNTDHHDVQLEDSAAQADDQMIYLQCGDLEFNVDAATLKERELVWRLGLAPEYGQLRFLRSRSRFQAVVTTLQAGGYLLSVVQRLAQHLAVSPLEALVCFLAVVVMLQLLVELYSCTHFQRPLLLRLNRHQFLQFWGAPRDDDHIEVSTWCTFGLPNDMVIFLGLLLVAVPFSALSIWYSVHYMHSCIACSIAALLFLLALLLFVIGFFITYVSDWENTYTVMFLLSQTMLVSSMVLATVSTTTNWELFHSPTNNSFSWILPHVSSQA